MSGDETNEKQHTFSNISGYKGEMLKRAWACEWNAFRLILERNKEHRRLCNVVPSPFVNIIRSRLFSYDCVIEQDAVDMFVESCSATSEKDKGHLLILACAAGASNDVITPLLNINPILTILADPKGWTPLHFAVSRNNPDLETVNKLLEAFPDMAKKSDQEGFLPLHRLMHRFRYYDGLPSLAVMECLLRAYPGAALAEANNGEIPLQMLDGWCNPKWGFFCGACSASIDMNEHLQSVLAGCNILLLAATTESLLIPQPSRPSDRKWRPADAAASLGSKFPLELLNLLLAIHFGNPEKKDEEGMLPLHVMAAAPARDHINEDDSDDDFGDGISHEENCRKSLFQHVLESFPDAARVADNQGRLPLHINAGVADAPCDEFSPAHDIELLLKSFPEGADLKDRDGRIPLHHAVAGGRKWHSGTNSLFDANPKSLRTIDPVSGLFPFMLAGASDKCDVSTVYELLCTDPSLVRSRMSNTKEGLKRKMSMLEDRVLFLKQRIKKLCRQKSGVTS